MNASDHMTPCRYIREHVFGVPTQTEFGKMLGYTQATISRFETGCARFSLEAMGKIRKLADDRGIDLDHRWFFEVPETERRAA